jgi:hypothetical protein
MSPDGSHFSRADQLPCAFRYCAINGHGEFPGILGRVTGSVRWHPPYASQRPMHESPSLFALQLHHPTSYHDSYNQVSTSAFFGETDD